MLGTKFLNSNTKQKKKNSFIIILNVIVLFYSYKRCYFQKIIKKYQILEIDDNCLWNIRFANTNHSKFYNLNVYEYFS